MKKKSFVTNEVKKWKFVDIFVIGGIILYNLFFENNDWSSLYVGGEGIFFYLLATIILIVMLLMISFPYIAIYIGIRYSIKKYNRRRVTFNSELDIEYYRDKLHDFTPAEISLLMDLDIEVGKDLGAMKLYYELNNIYLYENNFELCINNPNQIKLNKSDEILLNYFYYNEDDEYILNEWKEAVICETVNNNLIKRKKINNNGVGCGPFLLINLLSFVFCIWFVIPTNPCMKFLEYLDAKSEVLSPVEMIEIICSSKENIFNFIMLMIFAIVALIWLGSFITGFINLFVSPFVFKKDKFKRTKEGNLLAEKLYGMKNFIHDFSNLSNATKEHLVLWEDFLVYAVILEENNIILNEISKLYNIDLLKYR